jgi:hypothetical protein
MTLPLADTQEQIAGMASEDKAVRSALNPFSVRVLTNIEDLPEGCYDLFEEGWRKDFFLTLPWFQNFVETAMSAGERLRIYSAETAGSPKGMLVMRSAPATPRKLEALANYYTCFYAPHLHASANDSPATLRAICKAMAQEKPAWDSIEIKPMDVNAPEFSGLTDALEAAGFVVQTYFSFGNWYLPVEGRSFAEFMDGRPSVLRNTLTRKKKKLEKSGRAKIEIVTGGEGLETAIEAYRKVYLASWKQPEPFPEFVPGLIRTCADIGALRLGLVYVDGEPAAAQLWIVHEGRALIYKLAYDERFTDLSVGTILSATLFQHAIDVDKVAEVDYLSGDDAYKKDWMSQRRERWGILALNPRTPRGALAIARHIGGRAVKRVAVSLAKSFQRSK